MTAKQDLTLYIQRTRQLGPNAVLRELSIPPPMFAALLEELRLVVDEKGTLEFDGVRIKSMNGRDMDLFFLGQYAEVRWGISMTPADVDTLMKKLDDKELMTVGPLVIDQHFEEHEYEDPLDDASADDVKEIEKELGELGFENVKL